MGDVGKGPGVDKHWRTLQQLEGHTNMQEELRKHGNPRQLTRSRLNEDLLVLSC